MNARVGAREGASTAMVLATYFTMGLWPIAGYEAGLVAVPGFGATVGAVVGTVKAPPRAEVQKVEAVLNEVMAATGIPNVMRDEIERRIRARATQVSAVLVNSDLLQEDGAPYPTAPARGIDSVLEIRVAKIEVSGPWGVNPRGAATMAVEARLVRVADGTRLFAHTFEYAGGGSGGNWFERASEGTDNTEGLRAELKRGAETLAQTVVQTLFPPAAAELAVLDWGFGSEVLEIDHVVQTGLTRAILTPGKRTIRYQGVFGGSVLLGPPSRTLGPLEAELDLTAGHVYATRSRRIGHWSRPQLYLCIEDTTTCEVVHGTRPPEHTCSPAPDDAQRAAPDTPTSVGDGPSGLEQAALLP